VTSTSRCVEIGRTSSEFGKPRPESISCLTGGEEQTMSGEASTCSTDPVSPFRAAGAD
jgi:hypothetical protein